MKFFYLFLLFLSGLLFSGSLLAQCNAPNEAAFITCTETATSISLTVSGSGSITVNSIVDISGTSINLDNDDIIFDAEVTVDASTSFSGNGSTVLTASGTDFFGNGTSPSLAELNQAIIDCGCTTLAEAVNFALPVELLFFTSKSEDSGILLHWATSSESDNEFFLVEYSTDGKEFRELSTIASQGDSEIDQYYEYRHTPARAAQHYYRLWQYDLDGTVAELGIVTAKYEGTGPVIGIYPNPVSKGQILTMSPDFNAATSTVSLVSTTGQQWQLTVADGYRVVLPADLAAGLYYVHITTVTGEQMVPLTIVR